jgi:hypothetical protein
VIKIFRSVFTIMFVCLGSVLVVAQQPQPSASPSARQNPSTAPAVNEWIDNFDGSILDAARWERHTFEGGGGGRVQVEGGQLRMRGMGGSRSGVRTQATFTGDRFIVEATVARVGAALPVPGGPSTVSGNAILCVLFNGSERNRIEWILTSEGRFEAWSVVNGRGERLDNNSLGTQNRTPTIGIVRRGDEYLFVLNGEVGLQRTIRNTPRNFRVMLYGFGSSENNWDSVRVVTLRQQ